MRRLTHRDKEGRACWRAELLADDTGEAGALILETVADYEDRLGKIDSIRTGRHPKAVVAAAPDGSITEYPSVKDAARAVGVHPGQISVACINGKPLKGYIWDYGGSGHD